MGALSVGVLSTGIPLHSVSLVFPAILEGTVTFPTVLSTKTVRLGKHVSLESVMMTHVVATITWCVMGTERALSTTISVNALVILDIVMRPIA